MTLEVCSRECLTSAVLDRMTHKHCTTLCQPEYTRRRLLALAGMCTWVRVAGALRHAFAPSPTDRHIANQSNHVTKRNALKSMSFTARRTVARALRAAIRLICSLRGTSQVDEGHSSLLCSADGMLQMQSTMRCPSKGPMCCAAVMISLHRSLIGGLALPELGDTQVCARAARTIETA